MITIYIKSKIYGVKGINIDAEDFTLVNQYHWSLTKSKKNNTFYVTTQKNNKRFSLHRLIMNFPKDKCVDHINHNGLDNRKENLRICTNKENKYNRLKPKNNTSGYKGVCFHKGKKRNKHWVAILAINKQKKYGGYFDNAKEAAIAYNKLALKHHGEFANLNVID